MALNFKERAELQEWMDEPCSFEEFRACLRDLEKSNRLTMTYRPTLDFLRRLVEGRGAGAGALRIVDVGSGYGDMLRKIARWAEREGVEVALTGVDLNPHAARAAREVSGGERIEWATGDAFSVELGEVDVVICSLFTHHLREEEIVRFLRWMEVTARVGWFVNDLHRAWVPYYLYGALARVMRWHRFVRHDGPVSIRRSFVAEDWARMIAAAGLDEGAVRVREYFPARLCVERLK